MRVLPLVTGQPDRRIGALAKLADDLVLAVIEEIAEQDWMVTTGSIILNPLTR